jgi:hypothetical protein
MRVFRIGIVLAAPILTIAGFSPVAHADPGGGAVVILDQGCGSLDGNGNPVVFDPGKTVTTPSGNGVAVCRASVTPPSSGRSVQWNPWHRF